MCAATQADGRTSIGVPIAQLSNSEYPPVPYSPVAHGGDQSNDDTRPFNLALPDDDYSLLIPRVQFYGYNVTDEWMSNYVQRCVGDALTQDEATNLHPARATIVALQRETGIKTLMFRTAHPDENSPGAFTWDNPRRMPIIALCSNEDTVYQYRPTTKQVRYVTDLMGSEPQWWLDSWWLDDL